MVDDLTDLDELLRGLDELQDLELPNGNGNLDIRIEKRIEGEYSQMDFNFSFPEQHYKYNYNYKWCEDENSEPKALLGVFGKAVDPDNADGIKSGALITEVIPNTSAEKAGLLKGDVITKVNGETVEGHSHLAKLIGSYKAGEEISFDYIRNGEQQSQTIELGERKGSFSNKFYCIPSPDCNTLLDPNRATPPSHGMFFNAPDRNGSFLGITTNKMIAGEEQPNSVVINNVIDNSTAQEIGLQSGDIIYKVNDKAVANIKELKDVLNGVEPNSEVKVEFERDGKKMKETGIIKSRGETMPERGFRHFAMPPMPPIPPMPPMPPDMIMNMEIKINIQDITDKEADALKNNNVDVRRNDLNVKSLTIAPNPMTGVFSVDAEIPGSGETTVRIVDITGKEVYKERLMDSDKFKLTIDMTNEASGAYFLTISKGGKQFTKKVFKQ